MTVEDVLGRISTALDQAEIAYMLTGSFASNYYGAPRSTQDVDLVIEATSAQLRNFVGSLADDQYYAVLEAALDALSHRSMFNIIDLATGWKIDFVILKSREFSLEEFRRRRLVNFLAVPLFIASCEDIVIAKLEWAKMAESERQLRDVVAVLNVRGASLDAAYMQRWIAELGLERQWGEARGFAGMP